MEEPGGSVTEAATPSAASSAKSKLDTLSKDDLIKFAKKQMAAFQKMKSRCADLEKEVESLKEQKKASSSPDDSELMMELTERMDALLLEKAEIQQSLTLSRKDLEKTKKQAKDEVEALQRERDGVIEDQQSKIKTLEISIEESNNKHQLEVAHFQKLLKEREETDRRRESERGAGPPEEQAPEGGKEDAQRRLEEQLHSLRAQLEAAQREKGEELAELQESHQRKLTEAQQEVENLKEELAQRSLQHEEEMRALEEDCEMERERLLLLHEELSEQLALKDSFLQDVQEEEEEPGRASGIARMLELSRSGQGDCGAPQPDQTESSALRAALEDLGAHNTMLQDELTLLSNVKAELEAELERSKEEFQMEREEMDFKINELQMNRESAASEPGAGPRHAKAADPRQISAEAAQLRCEALSQERDSARAECLHMRDILQGIETELSQKTKDFVLQYNAMKEQAEKKSQDLQEQIQQLSQERDGLLSHMGQVTEEKNTLTDNVEDLTLKLEASSAEEKKLQASVDEQRAEASQLSQLVEELRGQKEELLSQLHMKESATQELSGKMTALSEEQGQLQALLRRQEEELHKLHSEKAAQAARQLEEKEEDFVREQTERELSSLKKEKELQKVEATLREEVRIMQETISTLQLTIKELSTEKTELRHQLEEALPRLSLAGGEKEALRNKLLSVEEQLEQEISSKRHLEAEADSLRTEAERTRAALKELEDRHAQEAQTTQEEVEELRTRAHQLEEERNLLRSQPEEAGIRELQAHIQDLTQERKMLREKLEEVAKDAEGLQKDLEDMKAINGKISAENQSFQSRLARQEQEQEQAQEQEQEQERDEGRELRDQLAEKEALVGQLRSQLEELQDSAAAQATSSEGNQLRELTDKMALLEKQNKEKDEKMNKIKAVAVKAKKELDISKREVGGLREEIVSLKAEREKVNSSVKDIIHGAEGYKNLQIEYDQQTERLDKEREKVEAAERQIAELTKRLSSAVTQVELLSSEKEDLLAAMETLRNTVRQLEAHSQELQSRSAALDRDLLAERALKEQKMKELSSSLKEVDDLTTQLHKQQQQSQQTAQELEHLRKEAQQSSLLDMEMADYERLVRELNGKLSEREQQAQELTAQIKHLSHREETLQQEIEALKSQLDQGEEKTSKMKQLLVKTKKDLSDAKMQESSLMMLQASLKGDLEAHQQQLESSKIEVCELTAERHRLQEQLRSAMEQQQRTSSSLQQRIHSLQLERDTAMAERTATAEEFESYKVRVHNVLKQQKSKSSGQSEGDVSRLEREQLSAQVEQLRSRLVENQQSLQSSAAELQQLQTEHDTLLERHNRILQENVSKEAELRERLLSAQAENVALRSDAAQAGAELSVQMEAQRQSYREQLRKLQEDHRATVETLQGQLTRLEEQLFNLQSQNSSASLQSSRKSLPSDPQRRNGEQNQTVGVVSLSELQSMAREEGEGMETTEDESVSSPLPSLEQLLTSPDPKQEPFVWTVEPTKEELSQRLSTATRSMEHMNGLLHETEATNAVLMEQITLLKSEVRRLERNQEREKSAANLEYLKNVLLQFIFLRSGSERRALLPVIHTMLQLSPDEKSKLAAIAQGEEEGSGSRGSGWSSYLHSWSGIR